MTLTELLRKQVKEYIDTADENSLRRVQAILEIDQSSNHWQDPSFVDELQRRSDALASGEDKGLTLEELKISIEKHKKRSRGK